MGQCWNSALWEFRVVWLAKDQLYPDSLWETSCSLASAAFLFASLGLSFWGSIVVLTSGRGRC